MRVTYDYWTDDSRAIQKIIDAEADAYITSTGKVFPQARAIKNEKSQMAACANPIRSFSGQLAWASSSTAA